MLIWVKKVVSFGKKRYRCIIHYKDDDYVIVSVYNTSENQRILTGYDNETEYVHLLTEDGEVLQKYNKVWDKFSSSTKIKVDNEPLCSM